MRNENKTASQALKSLADISVEEVKWYFEHRDEIKTFQEYEDYLAEMKATAQLLKEGTWAGKKLITDDYELLDLEKANDDFRKLMKLDEISEISGVYETKVDGQKVEKIVSITKNNFYNAFYAPIWKNLSPSERIRSLEWMFENINEKYKFGIKNISYLDKMDFVDEYKTLLGSYENDSNTLYLSLNEIEKDSSLYLIVETLAHELTHARQYQLAKALDPSKKHTFAELSNTDIGTFDYIALGIELKLDEATSYALYKTSQSEKLAELNGLKCLKKYLDLNEKEFGKNKEIEKQFNLLKHSILFEETHLTRDDDGKVCYSGTNGILTNEQIILKGQSENLLKLIMLKNFYEGKIICYNKKIEDAENAIKKLEEQLKQKAISKKRFEQEKSKLKDCIDVNIYELNEARENITYIKAVFMETLINGKLPKHFDAKEEFAVLNILDEPKSEYSLPKWLRKDEIKYNKKRAKEEKMANENNLSDKQNNDTKENNKEN